MRNFYSALRGAAFGAALLAAPASAQVVDVDVDAGAALDSGQRAAPDYSKTGPMVHVDPALREAYAALQTGASGNAAGRAATGYVTVDAVATAPADAAALEAGLVALGFEPTGELGAVVSGYLPVSAIADAAALPTLRALMAPQYLIERSGGDVVVPLVSRPSVVGAVTGEASRALRAEQARDAFDVDGSGVLIGVLSDSYNALGTASADVATGDLPAGIVVLDDLAAGSDEGRAMMQLAYDVAPGVDFAFHTAFGGTVRFAQGIVDLFDAGSDIIVDDVSNSLEPFFQDGLIAQAVDYVAAQGVPYFASAGNDSFASYEGDFSDSDLDLVIDGANGGDLHDFDPSDAVDAFQNVVLPPGGRVRFAFGYDEPSAAASGVEGSEVFVGAPNQAPTSDYDVFVVNTPSATLDSTNVLAASVFNNPAIGFPYEFVDYTNTTGAAQTVYVVFTKFDGADRRLKYRNFGGTRTVIERAEYNGAATVFGHSNAAGAFATGAAAYFNTAAFNSFVASQQDIAGPAVANSFTSYGGLAIRLDVDGNRIAPDDRMKPDAVASDGDNNTFFGSDADGDGRPNFFGTSAAAPNASAVAALILDATGGPGSFSPEDVYSTLEATAADLRPAPTYNFGTGPGYDRRTGFGLLVADQALAVATDAPTCSPASPLAFDGFNAAGDDPTFGEFARVRESGGSPVNLAGCSFVVFDPFTEDVTYAAGATGVVGADGAYVFATTDGDQSIPEGTLPDGPGAFVLLDGSASVGQSVGEVLSDAAVVAAVVYLDDDNVFGQVGGGQSAEANAQALLQALAQLYATAGEEAPEVDLSVVTAPNPLSGSGTVSFGLAAGGPVTVALYDALGRQVALLADAPYGPGRHAVAVPASTLPAGVYVVRVAAEGEARTARLTVVR